jgi:RNA polymerase sigma-70 factor (ECF subfamily)
MHDTMELGPLLRRCAADDRAAFQTLYERTVPNLFGIAIRIVGRRDLAEEVVQDAYVKIYRNASSYDRDRGSPFPWMASIVRYAAIDRLRGRRPELLEDDLDVASDAADPEVSPLHSAIRSQDRSALARCLGELAGPQRQAIVLAFVDGFTHLEVADRLNSPVGTVKSWIRRGPLSLKQCLDG